MPKNILTLLTIFDNDNGGDGRGDLDLGHRILSCLNQLGLDKVNNYVIVICPRYHKYIEPSEFEVVKPNVLFFYENKDHLREEISQLLQNESIRRVIKNIDSILTLSCKPPMELFRHIEEITEGRILNNFCIGEHGALTFHDIYSVYSRSIHHIPCSLGYINGFLFEDIVPPLSLDKKAEILYEVTDKTYLCKLLSCDLRDLSLSRTTQFLRDNFFAPGYIQDFEVQIFFIEAIAHSPVAANYAGVTFHMNNLIDFDKWGKYTLQSLAKAGFSELHLNGTQYKTGMPAGKRGKIVRILTDTRLSNTDYRRVYTAATSIIGCSGDNTFERVMSLTAFPFLNVRGWKKTFIDEFTSYLTKCPIEFPSVLIDIFDAQKSTNLMNPYYVPDAGTPFSRIENIQIKANKLTEENIDVTRRTMKFLQVNCNYNYTATLVIQKILHADAEVHLDPHSLLVVNWRKAFEELVAISKKYRRRPENLDPIKEKMEKMDKLCDFNTPELNRDLGTELDTLYIEITNLPDNPSDDALQLLNKSGPILYHEAWSASQHIFAYKIVEDKIKQLNSALRLKYTRALSLLKELVELNLEFPGVWEIKKFLELNPNPTNTAIFNLSEEISEKNTDKFKSNFAKLETFYLSLRRLQYITNYPTIYDLADHLRMLFDEAKQALYNTHKENPSLLPKINETLPLGYKLLDEEKQQAFPALMRICQKQNTHRPKAAVLELGTEIPFLLKRVNRYVLEGYDMGYQADQADLAAIEAFCGEIIRAMSTKIYSQPKYKYIKKIHEGSESMTAVEYLQNLRRVMPEDFRTYYRGLASSLVLSMLMEEWDLKFDSFLFDPVNAQFIRINPEWCMYSLRERPSHSQFCFNLTEEDLMNLPRVPSTYRGFTFLEAESSDETRFIISERQLATLSTSPEFIEEKYEALLTFMLFPKKILHAILQGACEPPAHRHIVKEMSDVLSMIERRQTEIKNLLQNNEEFQEFVSSRSQNVISDIVKHLNKLYDLPETTLENLLQNKLNEIQITPMETSKYKP